MHLILWPFVLCCTLCCMLCAACCCATADATCCVQTGWEDEYSVKSSWWDQLMHLNGDTASSYDTRVRFPNIKMINWFDIVKEEDLSRNNTINWSVSKPVNASIRNAFLQAVKTPDQAIMAARAQANPELAKNQTALALASAYFQFAPMPTEEQKYVAATVMGVRSPVTWLMAHEGAWFGYIDWQGTVVLEAGVLLVVAYFLWMGFQRSKAARWAEPWCGGLTWRSAVVLWCCGAVVLWCCGAVVLWCFGALVLWCCGALVLWCSKAVCVVL